MARRLDIGCASYGSLDLLQRTINSVIAHSRTDWRLLVVDNLSSESEKIREWLVDKCQADPRIRFLGLADNVGYAGAVKIIQEQCITEQCAYLDNDVEIRTHGWDEELCSYLDRFHELAIVYPNTGPYPLKRPNYTEVLWGVGFAWVLSGLAMSEVGYFDTTIAHQNEVDYATRLRLAGWKCACVPEVSMTHMATATSDPASMARISKGVVEWVNKWAAYFCGKNINYHSPNIMRFEDWPTSALHLEEYWQEKLPGLNADPEVVRIDGREYDLIRVPRLKGFYRNRVI